MVVSSILLSFYFAFVHQNKTYFVFKRSLAIFSKRKETCLNTNHKLSVNAFVLPMRRTFKH